VSVARSAQVADPTLRDSRQTRQHSAAAKTMSAISLMWYSSSCFMTFCSCHCGQSSGWVAARISTSSRPYSCSNLHSRANKCATETGSSASKAFESIFLIFEFQTGQAASGSAEFRPAAPQSTLVVPLDVLRFDFTFSRRDGIKLTIVICSNSTNLVLQGMGVDIFKREQYLSGPNCQCFLFLTSSH
jgi:hypothetical protein